MKKNLQISYDIYATKEELESSQHKLLECAIAALDDSYSPYSQFKVGAAILDSDNNIHTGSNQEVSAFPSCLCAERVALAKAQTNKSTASVRKIAIVAFSGKQNIHLIASPCGSCRQALMEAEERQETPIEIILFSESEGAVVLSQAEDLLPFAFKAKSIL